MFCPNCKDEFRAGFTRCESCGVDLVEDLSKVESAPEPRQALPADGPVRCVDYCGFFSLDEARDNRETLRENGIRSEITIRDAPVMPDEPVQEEYWLRVEVMGMRQAEALLDTQVADGGLGDSTPCGKCGKAIAVEEAFCAHCGERVDG